MNVFLAEVKMKLHLQKVSDFSLAPNSMPYTVAAYVAGSKGLPSNVRVSSVAPS